MVVNGNIPEGLMTLGEVLTTITQHTCNRQWQSYVCALLNHFYDAAIWHEKWRTPTILPQVPEIVNSSLLFWY
jgi:hypothetical protein